MIQVKNIQKAYGSRIILSDASFALSRGQKVALVGDNGTGKTTLLKIIAGITEPDAGSIEIDKNVCIGYLPQDTSTTGDYTISTYLRNVVGIDVLEQKLEELSSRLDDSAIASEYSDVDEKYRRLNGYAFDHRMEIMMTGFGLEKIGLNHHLKNLSSGQKSKVALAGILLKGVDLLLLDEPTNNLDLPALVWLEDYLRKSDAACILVSHDRRFLDKVVRKIIEIDKITCSLNISGGTYSDYLTTVAKRLSRQKEEYRLQQEEIERLSNQAKEQRLDSARGSKWSGSDNDKFLRGFKRDRAGRSSRVAKTIEKRIEQMDKVEKPFEHEPLEIKLEAKVVSGTHEIRLSDLVAGYNNGFTIGPISLNIKYGSRVGIMGLNGSGKSTLLNTIIGEISPIAGLVEIGSGVKLGNMMQEHESLPRDNTLLEILMERSGIDMTAAYAKLSKFGFTEQQIKQKVETLSPGGRARLLLAIFSAQSVSTLVLDEPTNHLDIEALNALEEMLEAYTGTVVLVSHDRYFLEKANLDFTYLLKDGKFERIPDYKKYVADAEERAVKLLKAL